LNVPVHTEIQLLFHYERSPSDLPPGIICSSKQAYFLCNLFFKVHGRLIIPSTHGRLYEKWALPEAAKSIRNASEESLRITLGRFVSEIDDVLTGEIQSTRKPYPHP